MGKEYSNDDGTIKFEGQYLNDKRNGKGKEYDSHGNIKIEGEYFNDINNNWIEKKYDDNRKIISETRYFNRNKIKK